MNSGSQYPVILGFTAVNQSETSKDFRRESEALSTVSKVPRKPRKPSNKLNQKTLQPARITKRRESSIKAVTAPYLEDLHNVESLEDSLAQRLKPARQLSAQTLGKLAAFRYQPRETNQSNPRHRSRPQLQSENLPAHNGIVGRQTQSALVNLSSHEEFAIDQQLRECHQDQGRHISGDCDSAPPGCAAPFLEPEVADFRCSTFYQRIEALTQKSGLNADDELNDFQESQDLYAQYLDNDMVEERDLAPVHYDSPVPWGKEANNSMLKQPEKGTVLLTDETVNDCSREKNTSFDKISHDLSHKFTIIESEEISNPFEDNPPRTRSFRTDQLQHLPHSSRKPHSVHKDGTFFQYNVPATIDAFRSPRPSATLKTHNLPRDTTLINNKPKNLSQEHENFLNHDDDEVANLLALTDQTETNLGASTSPSVSEAQPATPKLQWNSPRQWSSKEKRLLSPVPINRPSQFEAPTRQNPKITVQSNPISDCIQPVTPTPRSLTSNRQSSAKPKVSSSSSPALERYSLLSPSPITNHPPPFARSPFPQPVRDRSPVPGLSPTSRIRTCFRLGEAFNAASQASRNHTVAIVELYALVLHSVRKKDTQTFSFADLFRPDRPPFLEGSWTGWKDSEYWEMDSRAFIQKKEGGRMCRTVARVERQGQGKWGLVILSLWEADWDDVDAVKAIFCT